MTPELKPSPGVSPDTSPASTNAPLPGADVEDGQPFLSAVDTHVPLLSKGMIKLYGVWAIAFLSTFQAGYAIAAMTAVNAIPTYQAYFDFDGLGVSTGLVFSMWPIAAVATFWLGPIISDKLGRRGGMFICSILFILGTALFAFSRNIAMLLCARFILGASVGMIQPAAPPYIVELAPPEGRGKLTGLFNVCWVIGGVVATGISIGTSSMSSNWGWRIPMVIQLVFPAILVSTILFMPESPRWLYVNGHPEKAKQVLMKFHGNGQFTPLVQMELEQIKNSVIATAGIQARRWDYRGLFKTKANRRRIMLAIMMGAFGQLSGNGLAFFLPALYKQVGVDSVRRQLVMTLTASLVSLAGALLGTHSTDSLGRRKVLIFGTLLCATVLACAMATSSASNVTLNTSTAQTDSSGINKPASRAAVAFLILFGAAYGWAYQPLLPIYPSEVLSMDMRSTGMGVMVLSLNLASFLNQFAIPIALKRIGWWTYLPFICGDLVIAALWFFYAVETRNRTLEELDQIFESPNPVKASLQVARHRQAEAAPIMSGTDKAGDGSSSSSTLGAGDSVKQV